MDQTILWVRIVTQGLGIIGILSSIAAFQCKKHSWIVGLRAVNETAFGLQYLMLGAFTGAAMDLIGIVRNIVFVRQVKKGKSTLVSGLIFSAILLAAGIYTWSGAKSILAVGAKLVSTLAYGSKNATRLRILILGTSICWVIYNTSVGSWAAAAGDILTMASTSMGILRFDILPRVREKKSGTSP